MKKGLDRNTVVQFACSFVDQEGFDRLSLAALAQGLSVRPPSLYNHVDSLADLRLEIGLVGARGLAAALAESMVGKAGDDAIRAGTVAFRRFILCRPGVWQTLCSIPGKDIDGHPALREASEAIIQTIGAGLGAYQLSPQDLVHAIRTLRSAVHGFTSLELAGGFGMPDVEGSFQWLIDRFLRGLGPTTRG